MHYKIVGTWATVQQQYIQHITYACWLKSSSQWTLITYQEKQGSFWTNALFTLSANTTLYFIFDCVPSKLSNQPSVCELGDTDLVTGLYEDFILGPMTHNRINRTLSDKLSISRSCNNSIGLTVMLFINLTETIIWGWKSKLSVPHPWQKINSEPESRSALCLAKKYDSGSCHFMAFPGSQERPWSDMTHFWVAWFHNWLIWLVGWLTHWLIDWRIACLIT